MVECERCHAPPDDEQGESGVDVARGDHASQIGRAAEDNKHRPQQLAECVVARERLHRPGGAGGDREAARDEPASPGRRSSGLGDVANRANDVQPAHADAHDDDRGGGDRERDREAGGNARRHDRERQVETVVRRREDSLAERDDRATEADAGEHTQRRRHDGIEPPLGRERAHEVGASQADGTRHSHFGFALGGQHHEQVHEQQETGEHAEAPHCGEHLCERLARRLRLIERELLGRDDLRREGWSGRDCTDRARHAVGQLRAALDAPEVRDGDVPLGGRAAAGRGFDPIERRLGDKDIARILLVAEPEARDTAPRENAVDDQRRPLAIRVDGDRVACGDRQRPRKIDGDRCVPARGCRTEHPRCLCVETEPAGGSEIDTNYLGARRR